MLFWLYCRELFLQEKMWYRHLPLYRFLEKKSREMSGYEDRETYEMLARENGKYLGKQAQAEQTPVPDTVENPETEENPKITEKTETVGRACGYRGTEGSRDFGRAFYP